VNPVISHPARDGLWYRDAVIYQLHVRSFYDANGDGIGDFQGLVRKLDYLHELGVSALWLLPFYPSPLRDDGYDIADFGSINPVYGSMRDFRTLLREAHRRDLRIITELVLNHTSDQHPWFQRARTAGPNSRWGRYYVWSDTADRYPDARIIFQDFETSNWTWDPVAGAYYWHRFYSHQPDLNFDNPEVQRAMIRALDFWLEQGVDGMRLDAVPYLYERDGTMCENLPETHAFLRKLRAHVDARFPARMLLAEANQWPEDAAAYFGDGDECHMAFHFPVMPRLFMALQMEDRFPVVDILQQTPEIPDTSQWALFLRNHDELTLEMVTDEERDFMYRVFANDRRARINLGIRRRLAPLLGNNRAKIQLLNGLLMSLPGTPVIYYGDEIGMGDNVYLGDRDGVRTPMQWSPDRNAGFSAVNPQQLQLPVIIDPEFHFETVNVETQLANPESLLWWMRRTIALRRRHRVFGRGAIEFLSPDNHRVLAFVRTDDDEQILVVANLSRFAQHVELDLSRYRGLLPRELFGQTTFPHIGELPYLLTLGPHDFYWLRLEEPSRRELPEFRPEVPIIRVPDRPEALLAANVRVHLEAAIAGFLPYQRWFAGKARRVSGLQVTEVLPVGPAGSAELAVLLLVEVSYLEGESETYLLPLTFIEDEQAERIAQDSPNAVVARVDLGGYDGLLVDGLHERAFCELLLESAQRRRQASGRSGTLVSHPTPAMRATMRRHHGPLEPDLFRAEQTNTSVVYGHQIILKVFRRLEQGINPDLELGLHLNEAGFAHSPLVLGSLEYLPTRGESRTLAILHEVVPNEGDAWSYTRDELGRLYEHALASESGPTDASWDAHAAPIVLADYELPLVAHETSEGALRGAELLGQRIAELHLALSNHTPDPAFVPAATTSLYLRASYQSMRNLERRTFGLVRRHLSMLSDTDRKLANELLERQSEITSRLRAVIDIREAGVRTRYHGDLHLGQVLHSGADFVIIDFEGEPTRSLADRRIKRSPMRDVAGMLRSYDYARHVAIRDAIERGLVEESGDAYERLETWGRCWYSWVAASFVRSYLAASSGAAYLPASTEGTAALLEIFMLEKAIYELGYEMGSRPDWAGVPLRGVLDMLGPR
jgi:maltose alpha-D-glucosyltransferase/alpha-amylase